MEKSGRDMSEAAGQARHHQEVSQKRDHMSRESYFPMKYIIEEMNLKKGEVIFHAQGMWNLGASLPTDAWD